MGYDLPQTVLGTSNLFFDDASGYIGEYYLATILVPPQKCMRCGKPAAWASGLEKDKDFLCLQCADEWHLFTKRSSEFARMLHFSAKKWQSIFDRFLQTKPRKLDLDKHNKEVIEGDLEIKACVALRLPELYKTK